MERKKLKNKYSVSSKINEKMQRFNSKFAKNFNQNEFIYLNKNLLQTFYKLAKISPLGN